MTELIYLDHNATSPVTAPVLAAMLPWFRERPGNAASVHSAGREAAAAVDRARSQIAQAIGSRKSEVIFTSGATEANNLVLRGLPGSVVAPATEHKAVLDTARDLDSGRAKIVAVRRDGQLDLAELAELLPSSSLVSVMLANNETGVVHDVAAIARIAHDRGCLVHTDATQALGKMPLDVEDLGVDLASFSAHKVGGPKGVGALFVRRGVKLRSTMTGGGHERNIRSGTLNVPGIVGFGEALAGLGDVDRRAEHVRSLATDLLTRLRDGAGPIEVYSDHKSGLPNTLSIRFVDADGEAVMANCPAVAMSVGSACTAAVPEPSHVLLAMGIPSRAAFETLRLSLGAEATRDEVKRAADLIASAVQRVRNATV